MGCFQSAKQENLNLSAGSLTLHAVREPVDKGSEWIGRLLFAWHIKSKLSKAASFSLKEAVILEAAVCTMSALRSRLSLLIGLL